MKTPRRQQYHCGQDDGLGGKKDFACWCLEDQEMTSSMCSLFGTRRIVILQRKANVTVDCSGWYAFGSSNRFINTCGDDVVLPKLEGYVGAGVCVVLSRIAQKQTTKDANVISTRTYLIYD